MSVIKSGDNAKTVQEKGKDNVIDLAPKIREKHYRDQMLEDDWFPSSKRRSGLIKNACCPICRVGPIM